LKFYQKAGIISLLFHLPPFKLLAVRVWSLVNRTRENTWSLVAFAAPPILRQWNRRGLDGYTCIIFTIQAGVFSVALRDHRTTTSGAIHRASHSTISTGIFCGHIGALYTGCEAISMERSTWEIIKKMYRNW